MKRVAIEALLRWAYVEELPKVPLGGGGGGGFGNAWDAVSEFGSLWTLIDRSNGYGCVPDFSASSWPHADAVAIDAAVRQLSGLGFEGAAGLDLLADLALLTDEERADCHARGLVIARIQAGRLPAMIVRHAMLGRAPDASLGVVVERRDLKGPTGQVMWVRRVERRGADGRMTMVEVDGMNRATRRPFPGAVRKTRLVPDPVGVVAERAEYQAYVLALGALALRLRGMLVLWDVAPPMLRLAPWLPEGSVMGARTIVPGFSTEPSERASTAA